MLLVLIEAIIVGERGRRHGQRLSRGAAGIRGTLHAEEIVVAIWCGGLRRGLAVVETEAVDWQRVGVLRTCGLLRRLRGC